jgi:ATPase subunit of ABC transporter with duplicated ATPase domains
MIAINRLTKHYGKQLLFVDASFQLNPGDKVGLVGPNGSGKTTLFRMMREGAGTRYTDLESALTPPGRRP